MAKVNLGAELGALAENLDALLQGLSKSREPMGEIALAIPKTSQQLGDIAQGAALTARKTLALLEDLGKTDKDIAALWSAVAEMPGAAQISGLLERVRELLDKGQMKHLQAMELLHLQLEILRPIQDVQNQLTGMESKTKHILSALGTPAQVQKQV